MNSPLFASSNEISISRSHRVPSSRPALSRVDKASHSLLLPHRAPSPCHGLLPDTPNEKEGEGERVNGTAGTNESWPSRTENLGVLSVASRTRKRRKRRTSARTFLLAPDIPRHRRVREHPHGKLLNVNAARGCARKKRRWRKRIRSQPRRRPATSYARVYIPTSRNVKSNIRSVFFVKMRFFINEEDTVSVSPAYGMFRSFQLPRETSTTDHLISVWWDTRHDRSRSTIFCQIQRKHGEQFPLCLSMLIDFLCLSLCSPTSAKYPWQYSQYQSAERMRKICLRQL